MNFFGLHSSNFQTQLTMNVLKITIEKNDKKVLSPPFSTEWFGVVDNLLYFESTRVSASGWILRFSITKKIFDLNQCEANRIFVYILEKNSQNSIKIFFQVLPVTFSSHSIVTKEWKELNKKERKRFTKPAVKHFFPDGILNPVHDCRRLK